VDIVRNFFSSCQDRPIGTNQDGLLMQLRNALNLALASILFITGSSRCFAQSLRDYADRIGILIGAAVNPSKLTEEAYAATLAREFNMVEPENAMKWRAIRPDQKTFNFKPGDQVVTFAQAHRMKVRGHCLLWQKYNPAWLMNGHFTSEQLSDLLREHISIVMKHYAGQVFAWDVVNEAFDANGGFEHSIWYDSPGIGMAGKGTAYLEQAFRWARVADPKALLFYNDYDAEGLNAKSDAIYAMVKDFKRRGVPIDGVGLQAHIFNLSTKEISSISDNIARLTALGLAVHITEMDAALPTDRNGNLVNDSDLTKQAEIYRFVAKACLRQRGCNAFQTWGFTDKYSWIPIYTKGTKGKALLFDENYAPKPVYNALRDALQQRTQGSVPRAGP
jgi:endo-1,4-beta-xylanase